MRVINAGINGNTTGQMLARLDRAVPGGTSAVILQPGGNDRRKGEHDTAQNIAEIQNRLGTKGVRVIMMDNGMLRGLPKQPDRQHLTPEGYRMLAEAIAGQAEGAGQVETSERPAAQQGARRTSHSVCVSPESGREMRRR